ncbi:MAG: hypothetical protein ACOYOK_13600 [Pseudobdellovibrionaceae bacterium]
MKKTLSLLLVLVSFVTLNTGYASNDLTSDKSLFLGKVIHVKEFGFIIKFNKIFGDKFDQVLVSNFGSSCREKNFEFQSSQIKIEMENCSRDDLKGTLTLKLNNEILEQLKKDELPIDGTSDLVLTEKSNGVTTKKTVEVNIR